MKYGNRKTVVDGITFDSKAEANRYKELRALELTGVIKGLELQKPYRLCKGRWENGKPSPSPTGRTSFTLSTARS